MSILEQAKIMNEVHGCEASAHIIGSGLGACSLQRWQGFLHEYTVPKLKYPMIAWKTAGRVKLRTVKENQIVSEDYVMTGDMAIIPRQQEVKWIVNGEVCVAAIIFDNQDTCDHLQTLYNAAQTTLNNFTQIGSFTNTYIYTACNHLLNAISDERNYISQEYIDTFLKSIESYVLNYLGRLNNGLRLPSQNYTNDVDFMLKCLSTQLKTRILVEDIAKELSKDAAYLNRKFKSEVGITPHQYLLQQRIKRASKLLSQTDIDIATIAIETGFSDQSHLTKYFSKEVGLSPSKYRNHKLNQTLP